MVDGSESGGGSSNYGDSKTERFVNFLKAGDTGDTPHSWIFLVFALGVWYFDGAMTDFDLASFPLMLALYALLTLVGWLLVFRKGPHDIGKLIMVNLAALFIPRIVSWSVRNSTSAADVAGAVLLLAPVWLIYLYIDQEHTSKPIQWVGYGYLFVALVFASFHLLPAYSSTNINLPTTGIDTANAYQRIGEFFNPVVIVEGFSTWTTNLKRYVNKTLGPLPGREEDEVQLGVFIEDIEPTERYFVEGRPAVVWANLRGVSFEGAIKVTNSCYASRGKEYYPGISRPRVVDLLYNDVTTLECVLYDLPEGRYSVTIGSTFNFRTTAEIEYTYVDLENRRKKYSDKRNINRELDIPNRALAIYSSGPVSLGMSDLVLPISIDTNESDPYIPSFRASLENNWPQGEIISINWMLIKSPKAFELEDCIPQPSAGLSKYETILKKLRDGNNDDHEYLFEWAVDKGPEFFTSVSCLTKFRGGDDYFGLDQKRVETFSVDAEYIYSLSAKTSIEVKSFG